MRVPTATGRTVELDVRTYRALTSAAPGYTFAEGPDRAAILLRPGVLEAARAGDRAARHVVLHELAHVVLHHHLPVGAEGGRDVEAEADALASAILALIMP